METRAKGFSDVLAVNAVQGRFLELPITFSLR